MLRPGLHPTIEERSVVEHEYTVKPTVETAKVPRNSQPCQ
jgi:hypothetical protein